MFLVNDVWDEARKALGACNDPQLFRWIGDAVGIVANKEDAEGLKGYLDICTNACSCSQTASTCNNPAGCGRKCITLPREVETVIAVNIGGQPAVGRAQLFHFHLNGPGDCRTICEWSWSDLGAFWPTYRDLIVPAKLVAYPQLRDDNGKSIIVYGYDVHGNKLRRQENGVWMDGFRLPIIYGVAVPEVDAPLVARITGIQKDPTAGSVRLATIDNSGATGVLLAVYEPDEIVPQYRRIQINRSCNWVRVAYLKSTASFQSRFDHIPLKSRLALLLAFKARKLYDENKLDEAQAYEANAARLEIEAQQKLEAPLYMPPQVIDWSNPRNKYDYDIR